MAEKDKAMIKRAVERFNKRLELPRMLLPTLEQVVDNKEIELEVPLLKIMLDSSDRLIRAIEGAEPFVAAWYATAPEVMTALDVPFYQLGEWAVYNPLEVVIKDLEELDQMGLATDICTFQRLILRGAVTGDLPKPDAFVSLSLPCDGITKVHAHLKETVWRDVPMFFPDAPYTHDLEAIRYYGRQFRKMASFLAEQTGKKFDLDRLKEVIKESNKQYQLWLYFNELLRAVPCPVGSFKGGTLAVCQVMGEAVGRPRGTEYLENKVAYLEEQVKAGKGVLENEKIRIYWMDVNPNYEQELGFGAWLESEFGAVVVITYCNDATFTMIDPSTEDSIFEGLGKRGLCDVNGMLRPLHGNVDVLLDDITRVVKEYSINCVILPGHVGHKDLSASVGMIRERCRDLGVPLLYLGTDLFDPRYTPIEELQAKIAKFFKTMGLA